MQCGGVRDQDKGERGKVQEQRLRKVERRKRDWAGSRKNGESEGEKVGR